MCTQDLPVPSGERWLQLIVYVFYCVATVLLQGDPVCADRPMFTITPSPLSVSTGGAAVFDCVVTGSPIPSISWTNNDNDVIVNNGRFTIYPNNSLVVTNVQGSDAGFYTCHATNSFGTNVASAMLNVFSTALPVFTRTPEDKIVNVGLSVLFVCEASASPDPVLSWEKAGGDLPAGRVEFVSSGWMRIRNIQQSDTGMYICTAENSEGSVRSSASLTVHVGPTFTQTPADQICGLSQTISFSCQAAGIPTPHITWTTPNSGTFPAPSAQSGPSGITVSSNGTLTITTVRGVDEGEYRCLATNTVGRATSSSTLHVQYGPSFTQLPVDTQALVHESPLLPCQATGDPVPAISWFFDGNPVTDSSKYDISTSGNLQVMGITNADEGVYLCRAENVLGSVEQGALLTVWSLPVFIVTPVVETIVHIGQDLQLHCQAIGDPSPRIEWMKDNAALSQSNVQQASNGTLIISDINEENLGSYVCIAQNSAGSHQAPANVWLPDVPIFTVTPTNSTVNINQSIQVPCRASARDTPTISWYKQDKAGNSDVLIGQGVGQGSLDNQRSASVSIIGTLVITSVHQDDEGFYICRATNAIGEEERIFYLDVKIPPTDITSNSPQIVMENDTATLNCTSNSDPPSAVSWFHPNGLLVTPNDGRFLLFGNNLQVASTNVDDAGFYRCVLSNMLGSAQTDVQLVVQGPPRLIAISTMAVGNAVRVRCVSVASPTPVVSWWKGSVQIFGTAMTGLTVDENNDLYIDHVDMGNYIQPSDVYYCKATNIFGQDQYKITRPCAPGKPTVIGVTSGNVTVTWSHEDCSDVPSSSFSLQYQTTDSRNWIIANEVNSPPYTVTNLDSYRLYSFRVRANNALGTGNYSDTSDQVQTLQGVPSPPRSVRVSVSANIITVRWTSPLKLNGPPQNIQYQISYQRADDYSQDGEVTVVHNHEMPLEESLSLERGMTYNIKVGAGNTALNRWSSYVEVLAETPHLSPSALPTITYAKSVSVDSILVKWLTTGDDFIVGFLVSFRAVGMSTFTTYRLPGPELSRYTFENLEPEAEYDVKVAAYNEGGDGPYSEIKRVTVWEEEETRTAANRTLSTGVILAIVGGCVGLVLLLGVAACVVLVQRNQQLKDRQRHSVSTDQLWEDREQQQGDVFETGSLQSDRSGVQGSYDVTAFVNDSFRPIIEEESTDTNAFDAVVEPVGVRDGRIMRRQSGEADDPIQSHSDEDSSPVVPTLNIIEEEPSISLSPTTQPKDSSGHVGASGPLHTDDQILQISFDIPEASDDDNQDGAATPQQHEYMEIDDKMSDLNNLNLPQPTPLQESPVYAQVNKDAKLQRKLQKEREEMARLAAKAEEKRRKEAKKLMEKGGSSIGSARSRRRRRKLKAAEQSAQKDREDDPWGVNLERRKKDSESAGLF
ncbi:Down syndrome cell adhesion molecule-like protein 1 homolog isoform X1 [Branchiostoma floridae]|uniref:Down syndrome cell adhesion molecule-like protein 1 homolog isoform X1 n=1 Tax=Branchiostoma floridae TaxID=7739 RepID=A0A9J7MLX0_BRAFL|nr:Down syndrome cell adhesion molecule-like protein 1 homolog isoform X1 [Branchiostoma floridae]